MIQKILSAALFVLAAFTAAGCLESEQTYVVNPDGSGKVTVVTYQKPFNLGEESKPAKDGARKLVAEVIEGSTGIEVWKDVSCKVLADGRMEFKGTAYFSSLENVDLKSVGLTPIRLVRDGQTMNILYGKERNNDVTSDPVQLTEEEIQTRADSMKQNFAMAMGMMKMLFENLRERITVRVPGKITGLSAFTSAGPNAAAIELKGSRMLSVLDSITSGPDFWREQVIAESSGKKQDKDKEMRRAMFGYDQPSMTVNTAGAAPLFNYAAEVAAAKKGYPALLKKYKVQQ